MQNLFVPCPIRDHYAFAHDAISRYGAKPMDEAAARAIQDQGYHSAMVENGRKTAELLNPMWKEEIFSGKPIYRTRKT